MSYRVRVTQDWGSTVVSRGTQVLGASVVSRVGVLPVASGCLLLQAPPGLGFALFALSRHDRRVVTPRYVTLLAAVSTLLEPDIRRVSD